MEKIQDTYAVLGQFAKVLTTKILIECEAYHHQWTCKYQRAQAATPTNDRFS
jgi:hypothetical protein